MPFRYLSLAIPFTYFNDLMRHAALGTPTIFPNVLEFVVAVFLSISMLLVGFFTFNEIEKEARSRGSIGTS
jgi:ABC-2 type transport system permease protein